MSTKSVLAGFDDLVIERDVMAIDEIEINPTFQVRVNGVKKETIEQYALDMQRGDKFPPVRVWKLDDGKFYLTRGFHRMEAAKSIGREKIEVEIMYGTKEEAFEDAFQSNLNNGLQMSNKDKFYFLERLIEENHPWMRRSNEYLAESLRVTSATVGNWLKKLEPTLKNFRVDRSEVVGKDGRTIKVSSIGANERPKPKAKAGDWVWVAEKRGATQIQTVQWADGKYSYTSFAWVLNDDQFEVVSAPLFDVDTWVVIHAYASKGDVGQIRRRMIRDMGSKKVWRYQVAHENGESWIWQTYLKAASVEDINRANAPKSADAKFEVGDSVAYFNTETRTYQDTHVIEVSEDPSDGNPMYLISIGNGQEWVSEVILKPSEAKTEEDLPTHKFDEFGDKQLGFGALNGHDVDTRDHAKTEIGKDFADYYNDMKLVKAVKAGVITQDELDSGEWVQFNRDSDNWLIAHKETGEIRGGEQKRPADKVEPVSSEYAIAFQRSRKIWAGAHEYLSNSQGISTLEHLDKKEAHDLMGQEVKVAHRALRNLAQMIAWHDHPSSAEYHGKLTEIYELIGQAPHNASYGGE